MRKTTFLIMASVALVAGAQNKIDFAGRIAIDNERQLQTAGSENIVGPKSAAGLAQQTAYSVIVEFDGSGCDFGDSGVEVLSQLGSMAVVLATPDQMERLAGLRQVRNISLGFEMSAQMYVARPAGGVDAVQVGADGLPMPYTGKGVVAGLFDTGLDVNHINFLDAEGEPRTKALWVYTSAGRERAYTTPEAIKGFTTEDASETHGTHVLGIMSGSYAGPAKYTVKNSGGKAELVAQDDENSAIPFYGVATGADLAVSCGPLLDGNIVAGVQRIVEYAEAQDQPCVVNLSLGSNLGPHDGTDAVARYLALLGEKAVICVAAGNEGEDNISISAKNKTVKTFVDPTTASGSGIVQFWGPDDRAFTVRFIGYDRSKAREVFSYTLDQNLGGKSVTQKDMAGFSDAFKGTVTLSSNVSTTNNRYSVSATINVLGLTSSILTGFVIEPLEGQTVDGFAHNMVFASQSQPGFTAGSATNSISDMACGDNIIAVGSFTTAASWAAFSASGSASVYTYASRPTVGAISSFSSYGKTFAGKQLPDICAPGEGIISSYSQYYVDKVPASATQNSLAGEYAMKKGLFSRNSPWGLMQGTSMACPYVAGVVAMWLEADPTLTVADVRDVLSRTSVSDLFTMSAKSRFGYGKIDALAGLKEVLASAGIADIAADGSDIIVSAAGDRAFDIFSAGASRLSVELYSVGGACVGRAMTEGAATVFDASGIEAGVYIMKVNDGKNSLSRKIMLR